MILNNFKVKLLSFAVSSAVLTLAANVANAKNYESEMVIIHPFQWTYDNIAKECTEYLGPAGFDGVQISQAAEHKDAGGAWWGTYQPVNFKNFTTMVGNEEQLRAMIKTCNEAGVKVFADAVINQKAGDGVGIGGSTFGNYNYPDGFTSDDFHHNNCSIGNNYSDAWVVRFCDLSGMPDIATDNDSTRNKIADYFASLMNMGVYGFRIDAAKHFSYDDIDAIVEKTATKAGRRPPVYMEVIGNPGQEADDIQPNKYTWIDNAVVTDFTYANSMHNIFNGSGYAKALNMGLGHVDAENAEVFISNHDNEWGRKSAGSCSIRTQNNPDYHLAQSWLAVWPLGKVRQIYSAYQFPVFEDSCERVSQQAHDQGGPIGAARCEGGWLCQHRVPFVLNSPRFARATRGTAVTTKGFDDGALWFNRGSKGFYAQNTTGSSITHTFSVELPDGNYCDILGATDPKNNPCGADVIVSGGKATFTIPAKTAVAICTDEKWCGKGVDPCESDPTGSACVCKGETTVNGVCVSWCNAHSSNEECACVLNPNGAECQADIAPTKGKLCYVGTSNKWTQEPLTYNRKTGFWTLNVELDGKGDTSGAQRFKVTDGCSWQGTVYGSSGVEGRLDVNTSATGDEPVSLTGKYTLSINDKTMEYTFIPAGSGNKPPVASFTPTVKDLTVSFVNNSSDPENDELTYSWNFGNDKTSSEKNPSVTYDKAGKYTVSLKVTDTANNTDTKTLEIDLTSPVNGKYSKVAVRGSHDNYGTNLLTRNGSEWTGIFEFSKTTKFKLEALPPAADQCIFLGGNRGEALTASGGFISLPAGRYTIKFNEESKVLTAGDVDCTGDPSKCIVDPCEADPAKCVDPCKEDPSKCVVDPCEEDPSKCVVDTKKYCDTDGTTSNCENSDYAYPFLGAEYTKSATTFRIWSPDTANVSVTVNGETYPMNKSNLSGYSDVYEVTVNGDLDGKEYQFKVNGNDVHDPYGKMVTKADYPGGKESIATSHKNVVMNMRDTDLEGGWTPRPEFKNREDAIIYEVHVRDFTIDKSSGVSDANRGRYLGMVETGTTNAKGQKTGIDHLKDLGITHVQLMPVYDYGTCSNVDSQDSSCYNWGYDPVNFNVPEDRYTSVFGSENYKQKVKEFKTMVNEFHKNGIRVIMDVVYNHTYSDDVFDKITRKYYTEIDLSGVSNSTDPKNPMVSRLIRDSLEYWATEYNIDGFRFDLVGIFDVDNFKEWGEYMNNKYPGRNFLMYGEPWNGYATDPSESTRVRLGTIRKAASGHVGVFNSKYRECLKGGSDDATGGFLFNEQFHDIGGNEVGNSNYGCVMAGIRGGIGDSTNTWTPFFAADPEQAVQYISAHDNYNWTDKIAVKKITGDYANRLQAYGNGVILVSQGIPFIHAGEEFGRSKNLNKNSYDATDGTNDINWNLKTGNLNTFNYYKDMIAMRKAHPAFRMTTKEQIEKNITGEDVNGAVVVTINGGAVGDSWNTIKMVINSGNNIEIPGVDGWSKKVHAVTVSDDNTKGSNIAEGTAVTIWYK